MPTSELSLDCSSHHQLRVATSCLGHAHAWLLPSGNPDLRTCSNACFSQGRKARFHRSYLLPINGLQIPSAEATLEVGLGLAKGLATECQVAQAIYRQLGRKREDAMLEKVLLVCAIVMSCVFGVGMAWNFHEIIDGNFAFVTAHLWLSTMLGAAFLVILAKAIYDTVKDNPRAFGILMVITASGIVWQAVASIPASYSDTAHANLILKLAGALILMVNGLKQLPAKSLAG